MLLKVAKNSNRHDRVLAIFKGYLEKHPSVAPEPKPTKGNGHDPTVKVDTILAPATRPRSGKVPEPQAPLEITNADIRAFYAAKHKKLYVGREDEVAAIEKRIRAAVTAGTVKMV
jgi:hypothetical protein